MSSISSISSAANQYPASSQPGVSQLVQNFQAIGSALQSGDLATAQGALATFQKNLSASSSTSSSQPFGKNGQANTDYQALTGALKSGNLATAQKAYSSLQTDLSPPQAAQSAHKSHHHYYGSGSSMAAGTTYGASATTSLAAASGGSLDVTA